MLEKNYTHTYMWPTRTPPYKHYDIQKSGSFRTWAQMESELAQLFFIYTIKALIKGSLIILIVLN